MEDCLPIGILFVSKAESTVSLFLKYIFFYFKAAPEHIEILQSQRQFLLRLNSINDTLILHESKCVDFNKRNEIFLDNLKECCLNFLYFH